MFWTYNDVMEKLGDKAQVTAGGILILTEVLHADGAPRPKHVKIAYFVGESFIVTPEGLEYLGEPETDEPAPKPVKKAKKADPVPAKEPEESLDDLDI